jgi:type VI secretion system protein ImpA
MSIIDVESLLSEITAEAPCGEDLEYDPQFAEMEKQAQGTPERQYGDTIIPGEPPDWREVGKMALDLLERTRDLRVAAYLTRAQLNTDGLRGFTDGLALLEGLIENHWDNVYPQLDPEDDNDPTLRINTITGLCDPETILHELRAIPLVSSRSLGQFSLRDV